MCCLEKTKLALLYSSRKLFPWSARGLVGSQVPTPRLGMGFLPQASGSGRGRLPQETLELRVHRSLMVLCP